MKLLFYYDCVAVVGLQLNNTVVFLKLNYSSMKRIYEEECSTMFIMKTSFFEVTMSLNYSCLDFIALESFHDPLANIHGN